MFRLKQGLFSVGKDAIVVKVIQSEKRKCLPVHDLKMFLLHATFFACDASGNEWQAKKLVPVETWGCRDCLSSIRPQMSNVCHRGVIDSTSNVVCFANPKYLQQYRHLTPNYQLSCIDRARLNKQLAKILQVIKKISVSARGNTHAQKQIKQIKTSFHFHL